MKSIRLKLLLVFTVTILVLISLIGVITSNVVSKQLIMDAQENLIDMACEEAKYVEASVDANKKFVSALAQNQIITDEKYTLDEQIVFFEEEAERNGFVFFGFADRDGQAIILNNSRENNDVADRDFFQEAIAGKPASSDLIFSKLDGKPVIIFSAPVYRHGEIQGVFYGRKDGLMLSEIISKLDYRETGYAYMINNQGVTVAHQNTDLVLAQDNVIENMKSNESIKELGELTQKMITRVEGGGEYTYEGVTKLMGFAPIENSPWIVAFGIELEEVLSSVNKLQQLLLFIFAGAGLLGIIVIFLVSSSISLRIKKVTKAAQEIAQGNFAVNLEVKSKDEVGQLAQAFNLTLARLKNYQGYIDEISDTLLLISQGDLQIELQREYIGQFQKLKDNLENLLVNLSITLGEIQQASQQVHGGSEQIAMGAQTLSQGATEQASSIQELSGALAQITEQVKENAENASMVSEKASSVSEELQVSDSQMVEMTSAMKDITGKAGEISKIIKMIDDIAFQTNILALNAAVEAARAGASGRGFAVVAEEVRNLAAKSAEAAASTSLLIEETIASVKSGSIIADKTASALGKSAADTAAVVPLMGMIATATNEQAEAVEKIKEGIQQISIVVETNAATAEESAAASEELSGQSSLLQEAVDKFKLRQNSLALPLEDLEEIKINQVDIVEEMISE